MLKIEGERKMRKYLVYGILGILMLTLLVAPSFAWYYNEYPTPTPSDNNYENFGPRCDRLLIKLYSNAEGEWEALKTGELDTTDWPLTQTYYDQFVAAPPGGYADKVNVVTSGGESGIRNLDMNQNGDWYLDVPQNPAFPNPVANHNDTNPANDWNPVSDLNFRKAILSCMDRSYYVSNIIGSGFAVEHWGMLPPSTGLQYYQETFKIYPFNLTKAAQYLTAGGFKLNAGYRYWDRNSNDVEDPDEYINLKFVIRSDDTHRTEAGNHLADQLNSLGIRVTRMPMTSTGARAQWMVGKDAHLYTAGWRLGIEPDSIVLWSIEYYWHDGVTTCYNTPKANDPAFNTAAHDVEVANSLAAAEAGMVICNLRAANQCLNGPMWVYTGARANLRKYSGGGATGPPEEDVYKAAYWTQQTMVTGFISIHGFDFLNMHPVGYDRPQYGTIRHGFMSSEIKEWNVFYASWVWDNDALDLIHDALYAQNPYNLNDRFPWMAKNFTVGLYTHPVYGTCTKAVFTLRPDLYFSDGTPITMKDIYFTIVESAPLLAAKGYQNPWYWSTVRHVLSFSILDPMTFEVLIDVKSIWAFSLTGAGLRMLPEHVYRPIITTGDPTVPVPDPNCIGAGPWRLREYASFSHIEMVANTPGRTVTTNFPGATAKTNPYGFHRWCALQVNVKADPAYLNKFVAGSRTLYVNLKNEWLSGSITVDKTVSVKFPNGSTVTLATVNGIVIGAGASHQESFTYNWPWGKHEVTVSASVTAPAWAVQPNVVTYTYWVTIKQDIAGALYIGNIAPSITVDISDVARASAAFGSYPGHPKWSSIVDQNNDYKIDISDIARISAKFGWAYGVQ